VMIAVHQLNNASIWSIWRKLVTDIFWTFIGVEFGNRLKY
jgi:hypothetical protein